MCGSRCTENCRVARRQHREAALQLSGSGVSDLLEHRGLEGPQ